MGVWDWSELNEIVAIRTEYAGRIRRGDGKGIGRRPMGRLPIVGQSRKATLAIVRLWVSVFMSINWGPARGRNDRFSPVTGRIRMIRVGLKLFRMSN